MNSVSSTLLGIILSIPAAMIAFTAQGYAKAFIADKLGDRTPRFQGRLSLNPMVHLDPIGFLLIVLVGFGWTKPVETNPSAYKRGYKDSIKVSVAAPLANVLVGFIAAIVYVALVKFTSGIFPESVEFVLYNMVANVLYLNIGLAVFNIIPLPGLAGFDIFKDLFPKNFYQYVDKIYQYQFIIFIFIIFVGQRPLGFVSSKIVDLFIKVGMLIFGLN